MSRLPLPNLRRLLRARWIILVVVVLLVAVVAAGARSVYGAPDSRAGERLGEALPFPAAFVGGSMIWVNDVFAQERYTSNYGARTNQVIPEPTKIREQVLDHLVEVRLVQREARKNRLDVGQEEVNASFETIAAQNGGREKIVATLKELYGMDEQSFKELMAEQLLIDKFKREVLTAVSVRHILVKDQGKATELAKKVKEGGDFGELAKEQSEDTGSRDAGGSLGFVGRGATVKPFEDVAFSMQPGQISDPVQSEFGWHVIKVEEKKGTLDKSYTDWLNEAKSKTRIVKFLKR